MLVLRRLCPCAASFLVCLSFADAHHVPLFMSASNALQQGFVRVINHSDDRGTVEVRAVDDTGYRASALTFTLAPNGVVHFNSNDLEQGNANKGLSGGTGAGSGDWRLTFETSLIVETLAFVRTSTGFVTPMHDLALISDTTHYVPTVNPGSNLNQQSKLRVINPGEVATRVTIYALDDQGQRGGTVRVNLDAGNALTLTAAELEAGPGGPQGAGALGDGQGKWRLYVAADQPIQVMSLLEDPNGYLTNLSASRLVEGQLATVLARLRLTEEETDTDGDDHGDTRAAATDLSLGGNEQGRLDSSDDVDVFRVRTTEAGTLTVYTTGSTDTYGRLSDSDGTVIESNDDGGEGTNFRIEESVSAGTYFVAVSPYGSAGSYTIHARFVADAGDTDDREGWLGTDVGVLNDPLSEIQPTVINGPAGMSVMAYAPIDSWTWRWVRPPRPGPNVPASPDLNQCVFVGTRDLTVLGPDGMETGSYNAPVVAGPPSTAGLAEGWNYRRNNADEKHGLQVNVSGGEVRDVECWVNGVEMSDGRYENGVPDGYFTNYTDGQPDGVGYEIRRDGGRDEREFHTFRADAGGRTPNCSTGHSCGMLHGRTGRYENGVPDGYFTNYTDGQPDGVGYEIRRDGGRDEWEFHTFRADAGGRTPNCSTGHSCGMLHGRTGRYENGVPDGYFTNYTDGQPDGVAYEIRRDGGRDEWEFHTFRADAGGRTPNCSTGHSCGMLHGRTGRYENGVPDGYFTNYTDGQPDGVAYEIRRDGGRDEWEFHTFRADAGGRTPNCSTGHSCGMLHGRTGRYENGVRDGWFGSYANGEKTGTWVYYVDGEEEDRETY